MRQTPRAKAEERAEAGRNVAAAIRDALHVELPADANVLAVLSHRIERCNSPTNLWHGTDLHTEFGEAYDGSGRFWMCGSKLCPNCVQRQSRRARKMLRFVMQNEKLVTGTHHHFVTLTIPTQDLGLLDARNIVNHAWSVFRKKTFFRKNFKGGFKSEEFTINAKGFHYHLHVLATSRFLNYDSLRHYWSEAVRHAFEIAGRELKTGFSDGTVWAHVTRVWSREKAIAEVAKYITKSDSWGKLSQRDLLDACRIERWPRMVEFFGSWKLALSGVAVPENDDEENKTILDTESITDDVSARSWRDDVRERGAVRYLSDLEAQIIDQTLFRQDQLRRKYTAAKLVRQNSPLDATIESTIALIRRIDTLRDGQPFSTNSFTPNGQGGFVCTETNRVLDYFEGWSESSLAALKPITASRSRQLAKQ